MEISVLVESLSVVVILFWVIVVVVVDKSGWLGVSSAKWRHGVHRVQNINKSNI